MIAMTKNASAQLNMVTSRMERSMNCAVERMIHEGGKRYGVRA
jgi:hypothetical protein